MLNISVCLIHKAWLIGAQVKALTSLLEPIQQQNQTQTQAYQQTCGTRKHSLFDNSCHTAKSGQHLILIMDPHNDPDGSNNPPDNKLEE